MSRKPSAVDQQKALDPAAGDSKADSKKTKQAEEFASKAEGGQATMRVRVQSPFRNYFEGEALSLSAEDQTGPFDILPHHHNFISLLLPSELVVRPVQGGEQKIIISGGIMHVKADEATVFLDI